MSERTLSSLKKGQTGTVKAFKDQAMSLKLLEMGCTPGSQVRLEAVAPFGDPICVNIDGYYCLSLRLNEAASIEIE